MPTHNNRVAEKRVCASTQDAAAVQTMLVSRYRFIFPNLIAFAWRTMDSANSTPCSWYTISLSMLIEKYYESYPIKQYTRRHAGRLHAVFNCHFDDMNKCRRISGFMVRAY